MHGLPDGTSASSTSLLTFARSQLEAVEHAEATWGELRARGRSQASESDGERDRERGRESE